MGLTTDFSRAFRGFLGWGATSLVLVSIPSAVTFSASVDSPAANLSNNLSPELTLNQSNNQSPLADNQASPAYSEHDTSANVAPNANIAVNANTANTNVTASNLASNPAATAMHDNALGHDSASEYDRTSGHDRGAATTNEPTGTRLYVPKQLRANRGVAAQKHLPVRVVIDISHTRCQELLDKPQSLPFLVAWTDGFLSGCTQNTQSDDTYINDMSYGVMEYCQMHPQALYWDYIKTYYNVQGLIPEEQNP